MYISIIPPVIFIYKDFNGVLYRKYNTYLVYIIYILENNIKFIKFLFNYFKLIYNFIISCVIEYSGLIIFLIENVFLAFYKSACIQINT